MTFPREGHRESNSEQAHRLGWPRATAGGQESVWPARGRPEGLIPGFRREPPGAVASVSGTKLLRVYAAIPVTLSLIAPSLSILPPLCVSVCVCLSACLSVQVEKPSAPSSKPKKTSASHKAPRKAKDKQVASGRASKKKSAEGASATPPADKEQSAEMNNKLAEAKE